MMRTLYRSSDIAGEQSVRAGPLNWSHPKAPILYVHGASDLADTWMRVPSRIPIMRALTQEGYTVMSHDNGGAQTWGSDTAMARMSAAFEQLQADASVMPGRVVLLGQSMGGLNSILWAARNPSKVAAVVLFLPVLDLGEVHATPGGYAGLIDAALGTTYSDEVQGAMRSPIIMARNGVAPRVPCQIWYGVGDELCRPAKAVEYSALTGADAKAVPGGHAEETVGGIDPDEVVRFIARST